MAFIQIPLTIYIIQLRSNAANYKNCVVPTIYAFENSMSVDELFDLCTH